MSCCCFMDFRCFQRCMFIGEISAKTREMITDTFCYTKIEQRKKGKNEKHLSIRFHAYPSLSYLPFSIPIVPLFPYPSLSSIHSSLSLSVPKLYPLLSSLSVSIHPYPSCSSPIFPLNLSPLQPSQSLPSPPLYILLHSYPPLSTLSTLHLSHLSLSFGRFARAARGDRVSSMTAEIGTICLSCSSSLPIRRSTIWRPSGGLRPRRPPSPSIRHRWVGFAAGRRVQPRDGSNGSRAAPVASL